MHLVGPGPTASRSRYIFASVVFLAIYGTAQLFPNVAFYALALGYFVVVAVGTWWWLNERQRRQIARRFEKDNPDRLPDLRVFALVVVLQLLLIFPLLFSAAQHSFNLYHVPPRASWYAWITFTFDSYCKALFDWSEIYGIHFSAIQFKDNEPWGRHLAFVKRLTVDFVLFAAIWRAVGIYTDIKSAIQALARTPAHVNTWDRRAGRQLLAVLLDERAGCKTRSNAAYALGQIGYTRALIPLCNVLLDDSLDRGIRTAAASALGDIGDARAGEPLCKALAMSADSEARLSQVIIRSLQQIKPRDAVAPLCDLLKLGENAGTQARKRAADLLGDLGDSSAIDVLCIAMEHDPDPHVRLRAITAVETLCRSDERAAVRAYWTLVRVSEDATASEDIRSEARRVLRRFEALHDSIPPDSSDEESGR